MDWRTCSLPGYKPDGLKASRQHNAQRTTATRILNMPLPPGRLGPSRPRREDRTIAQNRISIYGPVPLRENRQPAAILSAVYSQSEKVVNSEIYVVLRKNLFTLNHRRGEFYRSRPASTTAQTQEGFLVDAAGTPTRRSQIRKSEAPCETLPDRFGPGAYRTRVKPGCRRSGLLT